MAGNNDSKVPVWKDVLLTLSGLTGLAHIEFGDGAAQTDLILAYLALIGFGVPGIWSRIRGTGKGGDE